MRRALLAVLTLAIVALVSAASLDRSAAKANPAGEKKADAAEIAKIKAYHDQIDAWAKAHPTAVHYYSTRVNDDNSSIWHAYPKKADMPDLETHASVWIKDGKVVATILSFKSDHTNSTDGSYFWGDGTLAYRENHAYSIGIDPPNRDSVVYYGANGKVLQATYLCSIDGTHKKPCDAATVKEESGQDDQLFLKNTSLPFYSLLGLTN